MSDGLKSFAGATLLALGLPMAALAQMTVTGRVTSGTGAAIQDATVSVPALSISARTGADGRYSFIIRAAQVMGQTVNMTARHGRFGAQTVQVQIVGGSLEQDFVLQSAQPRPGDPVIDTATPPPGVIPTVPRAAPGVMPQQRVISDPLLIVPFESTSPTDFVSSLAGRHAALHVDAANTIDGTASLLYRGTRSFFNNTRPLVVVDGIPVDNQSFTGALQRFGQGGFDFGSPLNDLPLAEVASVDLLDPVTATLRYGSRAANGVIEVRTRPAGSGLLGLSITAKTRYSRLGAGDVPAFQNLFGQGSGGQFEFFDGLGGGINDDVAESWGPRLDARALPQHSLTEPRRPDVRHWLPQPNDIDDYFTGASDVGLNVAVLANGRSSGLRLGVDMRNASGITPGSDLRQLSAALSGSSRAISRLTASFTARLTGTLAEQRPGTGFDEVNPVSGFTTMGRQVDLEALRARVRDAAGDQINWIYTNRNNPFFATSLNHNESDRRHFVAGVSLSYDLTTWLSATLGGGMDDWLETRLVRIAEGWLGGFPSSLGQGDFNGGGSDNQTVGATETLVTLGLNARHQTTSGWSLSGAVGGELRSNEFTLDAIVTDTSSSGAETVTTLDRDGTHDVTALFASGGLARGSLRFDGGLRTEQSTPFSESFSELYPTAQVSWDVAAAMPGVRNTLRLREARVVARWWRAGNEITRRTFATSFLGGATSAPEDNVVGAEQTQGIELGVNLMSASQRHGLMFTAYRERSSDLLVSGGASLAQVGEIFNGGFMARVASTLLQNWHGVTWLGGVSVARNRGTVDAVHPDGGQEQLSPDLSGAQLAARIGGDVGLIVGSRYLRAADGSLLLSNGLPIADAGNRFAILGSVHPDWTASLETRWSYRGVILNLLVDTRVGGKIFSATNLWGSYAGTLESTLIGDRAPGAAAGDSLTIAGTDSLTGAANTIRVSAEQYFHALGGIAEPWVYDASVTKLREVGLSYLVPTRWLPGFREHSLRVSVVGRNLATWSRAPNIDPSFVAGGPRGFELGQLPGVRSFGVQLSIAP